jgi:hypothetical protein
MNLCQQGQRSRLVEEEEEVIQNGPFVQPVAPLEQLLAVQASCDAGIILTGHLPTQLLGQILGDLIVGLLYRPPPSTECVSATEKSGP